MKRYLIPIIAILVLASGLVVGCGHNESTAKLIAYLDEGQPIIERHAETLRAINKAIETISLEGKKPSPDDPSKTQLEAIELPKPVSASTIQRVTVDSILRALTAPKTQPEPIIPSGLKEALISGIDTLDWALERMDSEFKDYQILNPPPEAMTYHGLVAEVFLKERAMFDDIRTNFRSLLSYGYGDAEALHRFTESSVERDRLQSLFQVEWEEIARKLEK